MDLYPESKPFPNALIRSKGPDPYRISASTASLELKIFIYQKEGNVLSTNLYLSKQQ
jgi:hypothetical protein